MSNEENPQDTEVLRASIKRLESEISILENVVDGLRRARAAAMASVNVTQAPRKSDLADDDIQIIWQTMPGGPAGWLKSFGYLQFARAIEAAVLASADNPSTAGAAKGGITSIEGLESYMPSRKWLGAMERSERGSWIRRVDVERGLAAPALNPSEVAQAQQAAAPAWFDSAMDTGIIPAAAAPADDAKDTIEPPSKRQEKLRTLADRIDHEKLWRRPMMYRDRLTDDQRDRLDAGVMLRRYADLLAPGRWLVLPPTGNVQFSAGSLEKVTEMAKRDQDRAAISASHPEAALAQPVAKDQP